jgi:hypothetical protein
MNPKYNNSRKTGNIGVNLFQSLIENDYGWLFRRTPQEYDFGIDGYIDLITNEGFVTGKSIAVQIKSGKSYFSNVDEEGFVYSGEMKHVNYYSNHDAPIVLILVNVESNEIYFNEFDKKNIFPMGKNWGIHIPISNLLTSESKSDLEDITNENFDYVSIIKANWEMQDLYMKSEVILISIPKDLIVTNNQTPILNILKELSANIKITKKLANRVNFMVHGYESDDFELYEIKEVVDWIKKIYLLDASWPYFLDMSNSYSGMNIIYMCFSKFEAKVKDHLKREVYVEIDKESLPSFLELTFKQLNKFTTNHHLSLSENKRASMVISDFFLKNNQKH